ncbi:hypothetical protein [Myroides sp. LJL119]
MIPIFKVRTFSDYLQDTIDFFKTSGKTFLTNYLKLVGVLLVITIGLNQVVTNSSLNFLNQISQVSNESSQVFSPINILSIIVLIIIGFILTIVTWLYPVFVLKAQTTPLIKQPGAPELKVLIKQNALRTIGFFILSSLFGTPLIFLSFILAGLLVFLIVGIPLLLIIFPLAISFFSLAFYDYTLNKSSFFESYRVAYAMIRKNFVSIVANNCIILILMTIAMGIPALSLQGLQMGAILEGVDSTSFQTPGILMQLALIIVTTIATFANYIIYTIFMVNQGMVYFSELERRDSLQVVDLIESIGNSKNE